MRNVKAILVYKVAKDIQYPGHFFNKRAFFSPDELGGSRPKPTTVRKTGILAGAGGWNREEVWKGEDRVGSLRGPGVGRS
jgi:hypothetical protein